MSASLILEVCKRHGLLRNEAAYVLATVEHETGGTFKPVRETFAKSDKQAIQRLSRAYEKGQLPWVREPYWLDGYFGRGYVQLTHKYNYEKAGKKLGIDLVAHTEKALDPAISAEITVRGMKEGWFTGKKLSDYITLKKSDFRNARRIVNGMDRAAHIAKLAIKHDQALLEAGYGVDAPTPPERPQAATDSPLIRFLTFIINTILNWGKK